MRRLNKQTNTYNDVKLQISDIYFQSANVEDDQSVLKYQLSLNYHLVKKSSDSLMSKRVVSGNVETAWTT